MFCSGCSAAGTTTVRPGPKKPVARGLRWQAAAGLGRVATVVAWGAGGMVAKARCAVVTAATTTMEAVLPLMADYGQQLGLRLNSHTVGAQRICSLEAGCSEDLHSGRGSHYEAQPHVRDIVMVR